MKNLLILLLFLPLPVIGFGQYQTPDRLLRGIDVVGLDTLLLDTITGVGDSDFKVINCDWDITTGDSIPFFTLASIVLFEKDTVEFKRFFGDEIRNYNGADSLFFQKTEKVIGALDTVVTQAYIPRIAFYDTPTTDDNNYFNVPAISGTGLMVGTGKPYSTIPLSIAGASSGDTIYLFNVDQVGAINPLTKSLTFIGVGNSNIESTGTVINGSQDFDSIRIKSIKLTSTAGNVVYSSTASKIDVTNCVIYTTGNAVYKITGTTDTINLNENIITGQLYLCGEVFSADNYYHPLAYNLRCSEYYNSNNDYFAGATTSCFYPTVFPDSAVFKNSTLNGVVINYSSFDFTTYISFEDCNMYTTTTHINMNSHGYNVDVNFLRCYFNSTTSSTFFVKNGDGNVTINNCNYDSLEAFINAVSYTTDNDEPFFYFYNNIFSDNVVDIDVNSYKAVISGNTFKNENLDISNADSNRILVINNNNFHATDSVKYYFQGNVDFYDNVFRQDTGTTLLFEGDSITISNNEFQFNVETEQGDLIDVSHDSLFIFEGNAMKCPGYYGYDVVNHVWNTTYSTIARYNRIYNATTGMVSKNPSNDPNHFFKLYYNLYINNRTPIFLKTIPGAEVYNNTCYNDTSTLEKFVFLGDNDGDYPSINCKIYNNIVTSPTGYFLIDGSPSATDTAGILINNNIMNAAGDINLNGNIFTLSQWQVLGYDANSFNTDPLLDAEGVPDPSSVAVDNGYYDVSLAPIYLIAPGSIFPNSIQLIEVTSETIDIGAYSVDKSEYVVKYEGVTYTVKFTGNNYTITY